MNTELEVITPEKAEEYLKSMGLNRTVRSAAVTKIARDILNGDWKVTHQGIAFNEAGELIDGQHRLLACVKAGRPIEVLVSRGVKADDAICIDRGIKRTIADGLTITGKDVSPYVRSTHIHAAIRTLVKSYNGGITMSESEMLDFIDVFNREIKLVYRTGASPAVRPGQSINAAVLAAAICGEDENMLTAFSDCYCGRQSDEADYYNTWVATNLARQVLTAKSQHVRIGVLKLLNLAENAICSFAHNPDVRKVKPTKTYKYDVSEQLDEFFNNRR